jgi:hypothetical protein
VIQTSLWLLFALIVVGVFQIGRWIDHAKDEIAEKIDALASELKGIKSKLG